MGFADVRSDVLESQPHAYGTDNETGCNLGPMGTCAPSNTLRSGIRSRPGKAAVLSNASGHPAPALRGRHD